MTPPRKPRWILPALALVVALAGVVRVIPAWDTVFGLPAPAAGEASAPTETGIRLLGVDSYFHLRHTRYVAQHFPSLMRHDPWTAFPTGARVREVGLFQLATGGVAWALGAGAPSEFLVQSVLAWTPVVLGVAAHVALYAAAAVLWGPLAGLVATALLLAYPGTFLDRSLLGFSDHHAAEVLLVLLLLRALARLLPGPPGGPRTPRQAMGRGAVAALLLLTFHLTWVGAPLWLVLLGPSLLVAGAGAVAQGHGALAGMGIASLGATFTLTLAAIAVLLPDLIQEPLVLQRILLTGAGLAILLPTGILLAQRATAVKGISPPRAAGLLLVGGAGAITTVMLLTNPGRDLWGVLTQTRSNLVMEHIPSWWAGLAWTVSVPGLLAAVAPVALLLRGRRTGRWTESGPVTLALLGMALAFSTGDYDYILAPAAAFLGAGVAAEAFHRVAGRPGLMRWTPTAALIVMMAAPLVGATGPARSWRNTASVELLLYLEEPWLDALRWLRSSTPDPHWTGTAERDGQGGGDAAAPPHPFRYGVLTAWDHGNAVASLAERPVLWSQGPSIVTAGLLLASPEEELEQLLNNVGAPLRYVVVDDRTMGPWTRAKVLAAGGGDDRFIASWGEVTVRGHRGALMTFGPGFERSLAYRLYYGHGAGMGHYRLVFQTREESLTAYLANPGAGGFDVRRDRRRLRTEEQRTEARAWLGDPSRVLDLGDTGLLYGLRVEPAVRIYERVEGALLVGPAPPGRRVHVAVMVRPGRDGGDRGDFLWESTTEVDGAGRWEVRVPYATQATWGEDQVHPVSHYRAFLLPEVIPSAGQVSSANTELLADGIEVTEDQVQDGAVVQVGTRDGGPGA